jgi:hypothetical protein
VSQVRGKRWIVVVLVVAGLAALMLSLHPGTSETDSASEGEPAVVEPIKGTDVSRVRLSADAARRLGIETAPAARKAIPAAAVLYNAEGTTFTYINPQRLVFVRSPISVDRIERGQAYLSKGPPPGTQVVTVGSQELFGTEYGVEED